MKAPRRQNENADEQNENVWEQNENQTTELNWTEINMNIYGIKIILCDVKMSIYENMIIIDLCIDNRIQTI